MRYRFLRFPGGLTKAVTLSYDDGSRSDKKFSDIISGYGLKCTFNLNGDKRHGKKPLSLNTINEIYLSRGHEVAVHGYHHRAEGALRPIEGIRDVLENRIELEKKLNMIIRGMAYPDSGITRMHPGASYESIKQYLTELDIAYCRTLRDDNNRFELPADWHAWMPTAHHDNPQIMEYIDEFISIDVDALYTASRYPRLFYLWGHSFEFDRKDNWEHLTDICEKLARRDDIWYATNIEIYDYVTAYNSLIYSADGSIIYNPTLVTLWFDIDGTLYTINSGETLCLES